MAPIIPPELQFVQQHLVLAFLVSSLFYFFITTLVARWGINKEHHKSGEQPITWGKASLVSLVLLCVGILNSGIQFLFGIGLNPSLNLKTVIGYILSALIFILATYFIFRKWETLKLQKPFLTVIKIWVYSLVASMVAGFIGLISFLLFQIGKILVA